MTIGTLDTFALILIAVLAVATPLLGAWDFRRLVRQVIAGRTDARRNAYIWTIAIQWGLVLVFLGWWFLAGREAQPAGLVPAVEGWQWAAVGVGILGTMLLIVQMIAVMRDPEELAKLDDKLGDLRYLVPQTPREDRLFAMVSVTAGVCEEILYRGLLLAVLEPVIGLWTAVVLSSMIFGAAHAYQGWMGIAKTNLVGLILAVMTVFSGSIFIAIVVHATIDLTSGRVMGAVVRMPQPVEGESAA